MQDQIVPAPVVRSNFVTVLAWIFIVIAGFMTLIALLQNIVLALVFPLDQMHANMDAAKMPAFYAFVFDHFRWVFFAFLLVSAAMLAAAVGLLRRWNWARLLFIAILCLGIVWNIGSIILQQVMLSSLPMPAKAPPDFADSFNAMSKVIIVFGALMAIGFSVLYGWLIRRLASPAIRAEFVASR